MRSREVRGLLDRATPLRGERVILFLAPGTGDVAFVAGRRIGGAVERNRARRILRAAWREVAPSIGDSTDVVLIAREPIAGARTPDLVAEMSELVRRERAGR